MQEREEHKTMAKKDFSQTNVLYEQISEATTEVPKYDPAKAKPGYFDNNGKIVIVEDEPQADAEPQRKMSPAQRSRAAKKKMLFYLTAEQVRYLDTMAGLIGTSKQEFLEGILQEHIDNDTAYKKALKLRKELQKETQKNG